MTECNNCNRQLPPDSHHCPYCGSQQRYYIPLEWDPRPAKLTYIITAINVILWLLMELEGGSTQISTLIKYGAKYNTLIIEGEYWRLFTSMFLHIGITHLFFNSYALINFGRLVEKLYGRLKFLIIYISAGLVGSLASFSFSTSISAGASGAIFGLMGALLYFFKKRPRLSSQLFGFNLFIIIGFNLFYGFTQSNIDNYAHIGGLVGGFIAAASVGLYYDRKINYKKIIFFIILLSLLGGGWYFANNHGVTSWYSSYKQAQELMEQEQYQRAEKFLLQALKTRPNEPMILFQLGYLNALTEDYQNSIKYFERVVEINPREVNSLYNLALLYNNLGNTQQAIYYLERIVKIDPTNTQVQEFLQGLKQ